MGGNIKKKIKSKKDTTKRAIIIARDEWGAQPLKGKLVHLKHPVEIFRYGYTGTDTCRIKIKCEPILQEYQQQFIDNRYPDQPFNFLIAGDGTIYEGRGWDVDADRAERIQKKIKGKAIDVGFIGDYSDADNKPHHFVLEAADLLMKLAMEEGYLQPCPKILNLNDFQPIDLHKKT